MNSINISNNFKKLKNMTAYEIILVAFILLYLISNVSTPYYMAPHINNTYAYFSLIAIVILLFLNTNPLIALFFGIAAIVFVMRSRNVDHKVMAPSTYNKSQNMKNLNNANAMKQTSLEEELVGTIQKQPDNIINTNSYHPVSCETHNATFI
uniref:Uncharacterized protein n=1 Tax=viral metagenome TaxID=1070528 RepID=A0A6C0H5Y1_9ZZZZ